MTRPIIALVYFLVLALVAMMPAAHAGITITPSFKKLDLGSGKRRTQGKFDIINTGNGTERYRIHATHFVLNEDGSFGVVNPDESSLAKWIKFSPKEFELPPNSRRVVRYVIQPRGKPKAGHYWAAMELENLEVARREVSQGEATYSIGMGQAILVPVFAKLGKLESKGEMETFELNPMRDGKSLVLSIKNEGSAVLFFSGTAKILGVDGDASSDFILDGGAVMPGKRRYYKSFIKPEVVAGDYTLRVEYSAEGLPKPLVKEMPFKWTN